MSDFSTKNMVVKCIERRPALDKRNRIVQHIPLFVSGAEPEIEEFDTLDELLNIECVKECMENYEGIKPFHRFSIDREYALKYDRNTFALVVGYW